MLAFAIGVQRYAGAGKCGAGYYDYDGKRCVTREECVGAQGHYVLEALGICVKVSQLRVSKGLLEENQIGMYTCRENEYLVYASLPDATWREISCVRSVEECAELYVIEELKMCVDGSWCSGVYAGVTYARGSARKCVTRSECIETYRGLVAGSACVEAEEPRNDDNVSALSTPSESLATKTSLSCGNDYIDKTVEPERCVKKEKCSGIPYDKSKLCLPDDNYKNWDSYKVYLFIDGKDKSYIDLETCLAKRNRYAYRYGQCSLLAPSDEGGVKFKKSDDQDKLYLCEDHLLTLLDKVLCVNHPNCVYQYGCLCTSNFRVCETREQWVEKSLRHYVNVSVNGRTAEEDMSALTDTQICGEGTKLLYGRICVCQQGMYYNNKEGKCVSTKPVPGEDNLILEIEYSYDGHPLTHYEYLVSALWCLNPYYIGGRITSDYRCVKECSGRYKQGEGGQCVSKAPAVEGVTCAAKYGRAYIRAWVYGNCIPRVDCLRTYWSNGEEICLDQDACDAGQYLSEDRKQCTDTCEIWARHPETGEMWCLEDCRNAPSGWPERLYSIPGGECVARCSAGYYKAIGSRTCREVPQTQREALCVTVLGQEYKFLAREVRSYSSLAWAVESDATAFLFAAGEIFSLTLRVTGKEVSYAPVAFFAAKTLVGSEFQYTAEKVKNSAILAIRLLTSPKLLNCAVFSSFDKPEKYPTAIFAEANAPTLVNCKIDLQGALDDAFLALPTAPDPRNFPDTRP